MNTQPEKSLTDNRVFTDETLFLVSGGLSCCQNLPTVSKDEQLFTNPEARSAFDQIFDFHP